MEGHIFSYQGEVCHKCREYTEEPYQVIVKGSDYQVQGKMQLCEKCAQELKGWAYPETEQPQDETEEEPEESEEPEEPEVEEPGAAVPFEPTMRFKVPESF